MPEEARTLYVVSDLHLGGRYPTADEGPGARGFRICTNVDALSRFVRDVTRRAVEDGGLTELVINGDFVDFLAEEFDDDRVWHAFIEDAEAAADRLDLMIERDRPFFDALADFVGSGQRLTILLGNHDVELSFPEVRRRLARVVAPANRSALQFIYDGEAYVVGNALIEHGNRYDDWNVIDHQGLTRVRTLQSRREAITAHDTVELAMGSRLVADVMNSVKVRYPFIDLLKPETTAMFPILLALAPEAKRHVGKLASYFLKARGRAKKAVARAEVPYSGDIASDGGGASAGGFAEGGFGEGGFGDGGFGDGFSGYDDGLHASAPVSDEDAALRDLLGDEFGDEGVDLVNDLEKAPGAVGPSDEDVDTSGDISALSNAVGAARLFLTGRGTPLATRVGLLKRALGFSVNDRSFDRSFEPATPYRAAAERLLGRGFDWVVMGHTHLARCVEMEGGTYLNCGTWADLIKFPTHLLELPDDECLAALTAFCTDLDEKRFDAYLSFDPTFVKLVVGPEGTVVSGTLHDYTGPESV